MDPVRGDYPEPELLVHVCTPGEWHAARIAGELRPESLSTAGFIHLSTCEQVHLPANRLFAGRTDLIVLCVQRAALTAPLQWEPGVPGDPEAMVFPHLYGPLPAEAVLWVQPYLPAADGHFDPLILSPS